MIDGKIKKTIKKKDSQLIIRINGVDRDQFVSQCSEMDTSAAREIRKFIRSFMDENKVIEISNIHRSPLVANSETISFTNHAYEE